MLVYKRVVYYIIMICITATIAGCQATETFREEPVISAAPSLDRQVKLIDAGPSQSGSLILPADEIDNLNPYHTNNRYVIHIASFIYESLYVYSQENTVEPWLVTNCEQQDLSVWKFTLRDNVRFHHGQELTAYDVKHTFRVLESSDSPFYKTDIFNNIQEIIIISSREFEIKLKEPDELFTHKLIFPILSQTVENMDDDFISGTGPFQLESVDQSKVYLVRNDQWWQPGLPYLDSVQFTIMPEIEMIDAFQNNEIDITFVKNIDFSKLQHRTDIDYRVYPDSEGNFLYVNPNCLFGRENRQEALFRYVAYRVHDLGLGQVQYFEQYGESPFDVSEFRNELIKSGLTWNENRKMFTNKNRIPEKLSILVPEQDMQKLHTANFLVNILTDAGIQAEIKTADAQQVKNAIRNGNYDLSPVMEELKQWETLTDTLHRMQDELGYGKEHSYILPLYRNQQAILFKDYIRGEKASSFWNPYYGSWEWYMPVSEGEEQG